MKKVFITAMVLMFLSSTAVFASDTPISDWINSKTSKITKTEQSASAQAAAKRKKQQEKIAKQKAKQAEARKKAQVRELERQKKAAEHKKKVQTKKKMLKDLFSND